MVWRPAACFAWQKQLYGTRPAEPAAWAFFQSGRRRHPGGGKNTLLENGWSAPGNRPCGEFVVVPRTPPLPPPSWSRAGIFPGEFIMVKLQSNGAAHRIWDTGSRDVYRLWASWGAKTAQQSTAYAVSGKIIPVKLW